VASTSSRSPLSTPAAETETSADVEVVSVYKAYGDVQAVDGVDLLVRAGEFFTLLGPSGSGKTTTLRLIAGFERPDSGHILLGGLDVTGVPPYARDVNTVFQDYALFPHMTVAGNVEYGLRVKKVPRAERKRRVAEALEMVRLGTHGSRRPAQLSGGQRQRVALARAIINRPKLLLLDEPLGALDLKLRQQMQLELKRIQEEVGITFVYVTHDQEEALTMSDRLAVFNEGRIEQVGPPAVVYEHPESEFVAGFVGVSNVLERTLNGKPSRFTVRPEKIRLLAEGATASGGANVEDGQIRDVVYVGMVTRYVVDLDAGGQLMVVRQNLETSSTEALEARGRRVRLEWRPEHTYEIEESGGETEDMDE
jgi:putative spermidine/putrescine transport system ATP-binding protein